MSRAAESLSVTQSAVSHQVRKLEEQLGTALFTRAGRALKFTVEGERLFPSIRRTLAELRHDVESFAEEHFDGDFLIAAPPTFTTLWLLPRLPEFRDRFPRLRFHLKTMPVPPPSTLPDADICIQFGTQYWPDKRVMPLVDTNYMPVCAPQLLQGRTRFVPSDLSAEVIIHDDNGEAWDRWLTAAGLGGLSPHNEIFVDKAIDALQMARTGDGLAINDQIITSNWIAEGHLIQPFNISVDSYDRFYVVSDHEQQLKPAALEFESWLRRCVNQ